jgi:hypothetical protein
METPNINAILPGWFPPAMQSVERLFAGCHSSLAERMQQTAARFGRMNGATSIAGALSAMVATPGLAVLEALRLDYGLAADDPRVIAIGEGTLLLYFYVRVQDDIVDEPELLDRAYVYVAELLSGASLRAFAQALDGSPRFFHFREQTMAMFAHVAAWEIDTVRAGVAGEDDVERLGQKFLPMAIPLGAMALLSDRHADLAALVRFVICFGTGLQLANDLLNIKEDHMQQRLTPVLRWLYAGGKIAPDSPPANIRIALLSDVALTQALRAAEDALEQAARQARALGAPRLAAVASNRAAYVQSVPQHLLALYLTGALA